MLPLGLPSFDLSDMYVGLRGSSLEDESISDENALVVFVFSIIWILAGIRGVCFGGGSVVIGGSPSGLAAMISMRGFINTNIISLIKLSLLKIVKSY
jgi:hypothetical protein